MTKTPLFNDMGDGNVPFIVANFLKISIYDSNGTLFTEHLMGYQIKLKFLHQKKKIWNDIPKWEPFTLKINWCFDCLVNSKNDKKIKQKTKYKIQFAWTHMHGTLKFCTPLLYSISPSHKNQFGPAFSVEYMYVYVYIYM